MDINVRGKHNTVPKAIHSFAIQKFEHLGKYLSTITTIDVELYQDGRHKDGGGHVADVRVQTTGPVFRSKATSKDYRASIDIALERLERRVKEFKRKRSGRPAHSRPKGEGPIRSGGTSQVEGAEEGYPSLNE